MQQKKRYSSSFLKISIIVISLYMLLSLIFYIKKNVQVPKGLVSIESPVDNFTLIDHLGVYHELYNYTDQKAVVLITHGLNCSINRPFDSYLNRLKDEYEPKGVKFLMINANPEDHQSFIPEEIKDFVIRIPILKDPSQMISAGLNFNQTGEAVVINTEDWSIIYRGAIHSPIRKETMGKKIDSHYLRNAIDALIEKKYLADSKTQTEGCVIDMHNVYSREEISFVEDVAPILIKWCLPCHNTGRDDTWDMSSYEKVKDQGNVLREVIRTRRMPPMKGDDFLSPEEIRNIIQWVEQGVVRGEGEDPLIKN